MSWHPTATSFTRERVPTQAESEPVLESTSHEGGVATATGPKAWPSADRESPAGPIQMLSVPGEPAPPRSRPAERVPRQPRRDRAADMAANSLAQQDEAEAAAAATRLPVAHSLRAVAFGLFEFQQPDPSAELRSLEQALAHPGGGREHENRGHGPRADAFALLGEIDFLDF